jgi:hypothetical protein
LDGRLDQKPLNFRQGHSNQPINRCKNLGIGAYDPVDWRRLGAPIALGRCETGPMVAADFSGGSAHLADATDG